MSAQPGGKRARWRFVCAAAIGCLAGLVTALGASQPYQWVVGVGSQSGAGGVDVAADASGNCYAAGRFQGRIRFGTMSLSAGTAVDTFVARYSADGAVQWADQLGDGAGYYYYHGSRVALDRTGNCYVAGSVSHGGSFGIFLVKFTQAGEWQWQKEEGRGGESSSFGMAVDAAGNACLTGYFEGTCTFGSTSLTSAGQADVFVASYDPGGNLRWVRRAGGTGGGEYGWGVGADTEGAVYVTGSVSGTARFDSPGSATNLTSEAAQSGFIAKYDAAGLLVWARTIGSGSAVRGTAITADDSGNLYLLGDFFGETAFDSIRLNHGQAYEVFLAKLNRVGALQWVRQAGGAGHDYAGGLALDSVGNCYLTGSFQGTAAFGATNLAGGGGFLAVYDSGGTAQWAQTAGDDARGVAVDRQGNGFVIGSYETRNGFGATNLPSVGTANVFIAKRGPWAQPPVIVTQPQPVVALVGEPVTFAVAARSLSPVSYQWFKDDLAIPGATDAVLALAAVSLEAQGSYSVAVSNELGRVTSQAAFLAIQPVRTSIGLYPGLLIEGTAGRTYSLHYTTNFAQPEPWTLLTRVTLTNASQLWFDAEVNVRATTQPMRFYRVVPWP